MRLKSKKGNVKFAVEVNKIRDYMVLLLSDEENDKDITRQNCLKNNICYSYERKITYYKARKIENLVEMNKDELETFIKDNGQNRIVKIWKNDPIEVDLIVEGLD